MLRELSVWRDGGSLGFVIGDQSGRKIKFVVDGKIGSSTVGWFFLNTIHTDYRKGIQLPLGGPEEKQLLNYLSLWLDSNFNRKELERLEATGKFPDSTKEEFKALHVKRLLDNRGKAIERIKKQREKK